MCAVIVNGERSQPFFTVTMPGSSQDSKMEPNGTMSWSNPSHYKSAYHCCGYK